MDYLVFPSPESSYGIKDFEELVWIPRGKIDTIKSIIELSAKYPDKKKNNLLKDSIPCIFIPCNGSSTCLIYSHGNACDIGDMYSSFLVYSEYWKVNVIGYEYPGYGIFKGSPSASTIKKCIKHVYNFATCILKFLPQNIIFFGRSIGTGPSIYLASRLCKKGPVGALILQSPYTTIRDIAIEYVGTIGYLAPKMFNNIGNIPHVKCPIILIHGEKDDIIFHTHSEHLFNVITATNKRFVRLPNADHNTFEEMEDVVAPVLEFFENYFHPQTSEIGVFPPWLCNTMYEPQEYSDESQSQSSGNVQEESSDQEENNTEKKE